MRLLSLSEVIEISEENLHDGVRYPADVQLLNWLRELRARRLAMGRECGEEPSVCACKFGPTHISEALRPLRERLALLQTEAAQAEVERELAAMRDCDRCTSPPDQRRWLLVTESLCYGCAVRAVAPVGDLELMLAMTVQEQLEVTQTERFGGEDMVQLCWLDQAAWERLVLLAELVLAPEPEVKP